MDPDACALRIYEAIEDEDWQEALAALQDLTMWHAGRTESVPRETAEWIKIRFAMALDHMTEVEQPS